MSRPKRSIMSSEIAFVGVGKCGCAIADTFREKGYTAYFINSSAKDLSLIDCEKNMKFHIPLGTGTNGSRELAKKMCREYFDLIARNIISKLSNFSNIYFCFSGGGGSGSGISPTLLANLIKRDNKTKYGVVMALPRNNESPQAKYNSYSCYMELKQIDGIGSVFLLNNNYQPFNNSELDFESVNMEFCDSFNEMMLAVDVDSTGGLDEEELISAISVEGYSLFVRRIDNKLLVPDYLIKTQKGVQYVIYSNSTDNEIDKREIENTYGKPLTYKTANGVSDIVLLSGMSLPDSYINSLAREYKNDIEEINGIENDNIEIMDITFVNPLKEKMKNTRISKKAELLIDDFDDF